MPLSPPGTYRLQSQANPLLYLGVSLVSGEQYVLVNLTQPVTWTVDGSDFPQHLWLLGAGGMRVYVRGAARGRPG